MAALGAEERKKIKFDKDKPEVHDHLLQAFLYLLPKAEIPSL